MRMYIAMSVLVVAVLGAVSLHAADAISLDGEWSLRYWPQSSAEGTVRDVASVPADAKSVKATVPGNCELDLVNAGRRLRGCDGQGGEERRDGVQEPSVARPVERQQRERLRRRVRLGIAPRVQEGLQPRPQFAQDSSRSCIRVRRDAPVPTELSVPFSGQGVVLIDAILDGKPYANYFLYGDPPFDWREIKRLVR